MADTSFVTEFDLGVRSIQRLDINAFEIDTDLNKIYWVHCDMAQEDILQDLAEKLQLSKDIIAAIRRTDKATRILEREDSLTLQIPSLYWHEDSINESIEMDDLIIHLTSRYCLTMTRGESPILSGLIEDLPNSIQYAKTPCFILFLIVDNLITHYTEILYSYEILAEEMDERVDQNRYKEINKVKKKTLKVKRHTLILLNILLYTTGRDIKVVSKHCKTSLSTLLTNSETVVNESDSIIDLLNGTLSQIDNALMRQVNTTMRVLTAIAAIFMPPSLIAAIYGMNFEKMPELTWTYGYPFALLLILTSMGGMLYYFKKNKWY